MNDKNTFSYTYSSAKQEEIKRIREKYKKKPADNEDAMQRLRRMDAAVTKRASAVALTLGVVGTLTLGGGMSLIMTDIATTLGPAVALPLGIGIGLLGMAMALLALPIYNRIVRKERERIAPEILRLTDELMK